MGLCERTVVRAAESPPPVRDVHVMYVATGKGFPYSPIDEAVAASLGQLVTRLTVVPRKEEAVQAAANVRPDAVLFLDGLHVPTDIPDRIRELGIRTVIWFTDDPYYADITASLAPHYDDVFTLESNCVEYYRAAGCQRVWHLPLGFYPGHFRPQNAPADVRCDVAFVGSGYWNRVAFFDRLLPYLAGRNFRIIGYWWERLRDYRRFASRIEGRWMTPQETALVYSGAKIVINMHREPDDGTFNSNSAGIGAVSPNPRTFEIAAGASLQLTDVRGELAGYFVPGREIETYASPEELAAKIDHYLAHEDERRTIALNGLYRTMRDHSYVRRLDTMLGVLFG
jgi:spore maturation protein CgeB